MSTEPTTSKLSKLQRRVLASLAEALDDAEPEDPTVLTRDVQTAAWEGADYSGNRSAQAAFSRALARLESRGLLRREHWDWHTFAWNGKTLKLRTGCCARLSLTPAGVEVAKRLTSRRAVG